MPKELDKETQQVYKEGEKAHYLVKNEDWQWAKRKLLQRLSNLDSVRTLKRKGSDPETIIRELEVRELAIEMILDWLDEIEGIAQQHGEQNKKLLEKVEQEDYILNKEE